MRAEHGRRQAFLAAAFAQDEIGGMTVQPDAEPRGVERLQPLAEQGGHHPGKRVARTTGA